MNDHDFLALIQSFIISFVLLWPTLMILRYVYRQNTPDNWKISNWSDRIVRPLAFIVFIVMIAIFLYVLIKYQHVYAIIAPIEVFLMFFFLPLYRRMD